MSGSGEEKLHAFVGRLLGDLGGAYSVPLVRLGDRLGLYRILAEEGPMTVEALAAASGCAPRYLREWASAQAASGYVTYEPAGERFSLSAEQAMVFALPDSPVYMLGAFDVAAAFLDNEAKVEQGFRSGAGVAWGEQAGCLFCAVASFFRPAYRSFLVDDWLPALDGVVERLEAGGRVADLGCGHGFSTILMARAFPESRFVGFDFHEPSVAAAREHAEAHGVAGNCRFELGRAQDFGAAGDEADDAQAFDLVTCFDCLHDMGDPRGAAAQVRRQLRPGGRWMIVEPLAGDRLADNLNPVGRLNYCASTMVCVPTALAQVGAEAGGEAGGEALGAAAGERRLAEVIRAGGFTTVRRVAETPFHMVLEASG